MSSIVFHSGDFGYGRQKLLNRIAISFLFVVSAPLYSQQLSGIEVTENSVDQNAVTLVSLASQ